MTDNTFQFQGKTWRTRNGAGEQMKTKEQAAEERVKRLRLKEPYEYRMGFLAGCLWTLNAVREEFGIGAKFANTDYLIRRSALLKFLEGMEK